MTREEVINELNYLKEYYNSKDVNVYQGFDDEDNDALDMAIEALEQEPKTNFERKAEIVISQLRADRDRLQDALDKIRAEIEQEKIGYPPSADYRKAIMKCLQIIDKYKAESEDKE